MARIWVRRLGISFKETFNVPRPMDGTLSVPPYTHVFKGSAHWLGPFVGLSSRSFLGLSLQLTDGFGVPEYPPVTVRLPSTSLLRFGQGHLLGHRIGLVRRLLMKPCKRELD